MEESKADEEDALAKIAEVPIYKIESVLMSTPRSASSVVVASVGEFDAVLERIRLNDPLMTSLRLDKETGCFGYEGATRLAAVMRVNNCLRVLECDGVMCSENRMGKEGGKVLAQSLGRSAVNRLHLNHQNLADEGVAAICDGLLFNDSVRDLSLNSNKIGKVGAGSVAELLRCNKTLTALSIGGNSEAGPDGIIEISQALLQNSTLQCLALSSIPLNVCEVSTALGRVLRTNTRLCHVYLVDCRLDFDTIKPLAHSLCFCPTLTTLDLSENNRIRDDGCEQVATALHHNTSLTTLLLHWAGISSTGATSIAGALRVNTTLQVLGLDHNMDIGSEGVAQLADGLHSNKSLQELHLRGTSQVQVGIDAARALGQALHRRPPSVQFRLLEMDRQLKLNSPFHNLGLPAEARSWNDHQIFTHLREQVAKEAASVIEEQAEPQDDKVQVQLQQAIIVSKLDRGLLSKRRVNANGTLTEEAPVTASSDADPLVQALELLSRPLGTGTAELDRRDTEIHQLHDDLKRLEDNARQAEQALQNDLAFKNKELKALKLEFEKQLQQILWEKDEEISALKKELGLHKDLRAAAAQAAAAYEARVKAASAQASSYASAATAAETTAMHKHLSSLASLRMVKAVNRAAAPSANLRQQIVSNQEDDIHDDRGGGRGGFLACFAYFLCIACVIVVLLGLDSFICEVCRAGDLYAANGRQIGKRWAGTISASFKSKLSSTALSTTTEHPSHSPLLEICEQPSPHIDRGEVEEKEEMKEAKEIEVVVKPASHESWWTKQKKRIARKYKQTPEGDTAKEDRRDR